MSILYNFNTQLTSGTFPENIFSDYSNKKNGNWTSKTYPKQPIQILKS